MKKICKILIAGCLILAGLTGCGSDESSTGSVTDSLNQTPTIEDLMEQAAAQQTLEEQQAATVLPETVLPESEPEPEPEPEPVNIPEGYGSYESVDIDLTTLNAVLVYTQVYDMVSNPENYIGKTVKMHGSFGYYYEASVDTYYFGIVVQDATACCAQGIEFTLADEASWIFPEDYPDPGADATVVGVFNTYFPEEAPDWEYYRLEQAEFITE